MENMDFHNFKEERNEKHYYQALKIVCGIFGTIFSIFVVFMIARLFFYIDFKYYTVSGPSMQPTINESISNLETRDAVFINKKAEAKRGDIVIIQLPGYSKTIIKRLIATEGDEICIRRYPEYNNEYRLSVKYAGSEKIEVVYEDYIKSYEEWKNVGSYSYSYEGGAAVEYEANFFNNYLNKDNMNDFVMLEEDGCLYYKLGAGQIFYMGDNRLRSADARANGPGKEDYIVGVVKIIMRDVVDAKSEVELWWKKFTAVMNYFFDEIGNFFAWSY